MIRTFITVIKNVKLNEVEKPLGRWTLNNEISTLTTEISKSQLESIDVDKQYKKVLSTLSVAKNQKQQIEDDIQNLVDIEQKILDYDLYLMALSKDGVPYELISKAIPSIETEMQADDWNYNKLPTFYRSKINYSIIKLLYCQLQHFKW